MLSLFGNKNKIAKFKAWAKKQIFWRTGHSFFWRSYGNLIYPYIKKTEMNTDSKTFQNDKNIYNNKFTVSKSCTLLNKIYL